MNLTTCPLCLNEAWFYPGQTINNKIICIYQCEKEGYFAFTPVLDNWWRSKTDLPEEKQAFLQRNRRMKLREFIVRKDISPATIPVFALTDE